MHKPIQINDLGVSFPSKLCFEQFNYHLHFGQRIAIIGRNGCGKSTLLNILAKHREGTSGDIIIPAETVIAYVPQFIEHSDHLSGGEQLNTAIIASLDSHPDMLLLDEPTNHLDRSNRHSLIQRLNAYRGTLVIVSHDIELLDSCIDTLWHIDHGRIHVFSGRYHDYMRENQYKKQAIEREVSRLERERISLHQGLMKEQERGAKSRLKGKKSLKQQKWSPVVGHTKAQQAENTVGSKRSAIDNKKQQLNNTLSELYIPESLLPTFSICAADIRDQQLIAIRQGAIGYVDNENIVDNLFLSLDSRTRLAIRGKNGSGKTTLIKAILNDPTVYKTGDWLLPKKTDIGYLDQHYNTLDFEHTVIENLEQVISDWPYSEKRRFLNSFLFRKNEDVNRNVKQLSGGERARLCLAKIAAAPPKILILDEITNNLDLETRQHIIDILQSYPAALLVISHDHDFLQQIGITEFLDL